MENIQGSFKLNKNIERFSSEGYVLLSLSDQKIVEFLRKRLESKLSERLGRKIDLPDYHQFVQDDELHTDIQLEMLEFLHETELHLDVLTKNISVIKLLMGPDVEVQVSPHLRIARPGKPQDNIGFHSDIDYGNTSYEMSCVIALNKLDESGALKILPASHARPQLPTIAVVNDEAQKGSKLNRLGVPYMYKRIVDESYKEDIVPIPINIGEILFFCLGLVHGQEINNSSDTRWSIDCRVKNIHAPTNTREGYYKPLSKSPLTQAAEKFLEQNESHKL